jgi:GAF domain-containing protein
MNLIKEIDELNYDFCTLHDPPAVMAALVKRLVDHYAMAAAGIWRLDAGQAHLTLAASAGSPAFPPSLHEVSASHSLLGRAAQAKLPQAYSGSAAEGDALAQWAEQNQFRFLSAFPLANESKATGVLLLAAPQTPDESQLAILRLHARLASIALHEADCFVCLRHNSERLQSMVEAGKVFNSTLDLSELLGKILDVAKDLTKAERGTLFLIDEKTDELWSLIAQGMEKQEIRLPRGLGIAGHVAQTGEIVNIPDAYADDRFNPEVDKRTGFLTRNILTLPIRNKAAKIVATLQLLNKSTGSFTEEDTDVLLTLSGQMAMSLENAQLHRDLL